MSELWATTRPITANNMVSIYVHRLRKEVLGVSREGACTPGTRLSAAGLTARRGLPGVRVARRSGRAALAAADPQRARVAQRGAGLLRGRLLADVLRHRFLIGPGRSCG